jgi:hypothetical protein
MFGSQEIEFALDSPLEGDGFEPSVPFERQNELGAPIALDRAALQPLSV